MFLACGGIEIRGGFEGSSKQISLELKLAGVLVVDRLRGPIKSDVIRFTEGNIQ